MCSNCLSASLFFNYRKKNSQIKAFEMAKVLHHLKSKRARHKPKALSWPFLSTHVHVYISGRIICQKRCNFVDRSRNWRPVNKRAWPPTSFEMHRSRCLSVCLSVKTRSIVLGGEMRTKCLILSVLYLICCITLFPRGSDRSRRNRVKAVNLEYFFV